MDTLNRKMAIERGLTSEKAQSRPIKVIQFGEGGFLRAFVDWTFQQLNNNGLFNGNVAIVQPMPSGRVDNLRRQDNLYTVVLQGILDGKKVLSNTLIDSIGATVKVNDEWQSYLELADNPEAKIIISNTTEAGIAVTENDTADMTPPQGYPAKLALLLKRRYDDGLPGFLLIPCELIADNGKALREAVVTMSRQFGFGADFIKWVEQENTFVSTLVDRIVPGYPAAQAESLFEQIGYRDDMLDKAEPFYSWVIAGDEKARKMVDELIPARKLGINLILTDDVQPYRERKVYLLNGPHTTLAQVARLEGMSTVGETMDDETMHSFVLKEMNEEIIPVLSLPKNELETFASQVLERFSNPYNEHKLDSIGLNSVSKYAVRLLPLVTANAEKTGRLPQRIVLALAALLYTYGGFAQGKVAIKDDADVTDTLVALAKNSTYIHDALAQSKLWGQDLTRIKGLEELVEKDFEGIRASGIEALVAKLA
ncbi:tagaturonate reductase [Bifidobacterium sp. ESL0704]|uniref:tagaturonate reductase n=1 Tax=Bifidobacterium sp. ESL0704 TaxID=2983219 RepID=UPI0023FA135E|nr:tagaturonate reductase [Bifidobacterium sp. ESL0704]WEV53275.1 tagaturonate reductase [Bifidobacterium sp. ESL0704]